MRMLSSTLKPESSSPFHLRTSPSHSNIFIMDSNTPRCISHNLKHTELMKFGISSCPYCKMVFPFAPELDSMVTSQRKPSTIFQPKSATRPTRTPPSKNSSIPVVDLVDDTPALAPEQPRFAGFWEKKELIESHRQESMARSQKKEKKSHAGNSTVSSQNRQPKTIPVPEKIQINLVHGTAGDAKSFVQLGKKTFNLLHIAHCADFCGLGSFIFTVEDTNDEIANHFDFIKEKILPDSLDWEQLQTSHPEIPPISLLYFASTWTIRSGATRLSNKTVKSTMSWKDLLTNFAGNPKSVWILVEYEYVEAEEEEEKEPTPAKRSPFKPIPFRSLSGSAIKPKNKSIKVNILSFVCIKYHD